MTDVHDDWGAESGDKAITEALAALAGELVGLQLPGAKIRERKHLQPMLEEVLPKTLPGPGDVRGGRRLKLDSFQPNVGGFDIRVDRPGGGGPAWLAELKWSYETPNKLFEAAWDAVKLALAQDQYEQVTRAWLVSGGSRAMWAQTETPDLFADGEVDVDELWRRPLPPKGGPNSGATVGADLEIGGWANMFVRAPRLKITLVADEHLHLADGEWILKAAAVEPMEPWVDPFTRELPTTGR